VQGSDTNSSRIGNSTTTHISEVATADLVAHEQNKLTAILDETEHGYYA
jgi:hypothetical protein